VNTQVINNTTVADITRRLVS